MFGLFKNKATEAVNKFSGQTDFLGAMISPTDKDALIGRLSAELAQANDRLALAIEVLPPFAAEGTEMPAHVPDDTMYRDDMEDLLSEFTLGDCRRARALIARLTDGPADG